MLRGNIASTSLKMLLKNLYSVKCYDKLNMNVLTLSLWENIWWGLIYFDQFIKRTADCGLNFREHLNIHFDAKITIQHRPSDGDLGFIQ